MISKGRKTLSVNTESRVEICGVAARAKKTITLLEIIYCKNNKGIYIENTVYYSEYVSALNTTPTVLLQ